MSDIEVREFDGSPEQWDQWVAVAPGALFCHQYEWLQLVRDVYGGDPCYLAAYRGDDIVGVLPVMLRRIIGEGRVLYAIPFVDEGGCCAFDAEVESQLVRAAITRGGDLGAGYLEVRQRTPLSIEAVRGEDRVTLELPLPDTTEALWDSLSKNMRKKVRRAERDGLVAEDAGIQFLDTFYDIYAANMQDLGSPMHSRGFFEQLFSRFGSSMLGVAVMQEETGRTVGAAVAIGFRDVMTVLCAHSGREHFDLYPNNLLYWRLLEAAVERGYSVANFGRSPVGSGIYQYKKSWHMEDHQLFYCRVPIHRQPVNRDGRDGMAYAMFRKVWPRMPAWIARAVGPRLWSRLPV